MGKYDNIDFVPPQSVANNASRGLKLRKKYGKGGLSRKKASKLGIGSGVQRAINLKNRDKLSPSTVKRMKSFFARHSVYKKYHKTNPPSKSYISWLLWGGDAGKRWAEKIVKQIKKANKK